MARGGGSSVKQSVLKRVAGLAAAAIAAAASPAFAADAPDTAPAVDVVAPGGWRWSSPFSPCDMNCSATVYVGKYVKTPMSDIFLKFKTPPWDWKTRDSQLLSGSFSREVLSYDDLFAFETELGVGKRFGDQKQTELWAALYARWKYFPWNDYVRTSVAISTGVNWASSVSQIEREKSPGHTSEVLHYLSPEITFGLPQTPNLDLVFRFHHRSGGDLGVFNKTGGASQYQTVGLRYTW